MHTETVKIRVDFMPGERWRGEDGTEYNYRVLTGVYTSTKQVRAWAWVVVRVRDSYHRSLLSTSTQQDSGRGQFKPNPNPNPYPNPNQDSGMGQFKGSAYVYTVAGVHPPSDPLDTDFAAFMVKLQPHALAMNDYFGASVSVERRLTLTLAEAYNPNPNPNPSPKRKREPKPKLKPNPNQVSVEHGVLAVGAPGDVDSEVDLWRKQTIYNTSQTDGIMKAYEKAYPSSKAGQKTLTLPLPLTPYPYPYP